MPKAKILTKKSKRDDLGRFVKGSKPLNKPANCPLCGEWFFGSHHMAHHLKNCPGTTIDTLMDLLRRKGFTNVGRKRLCWLPPKTAAHRYKIQGRRAHIIVFMVVKGPVPPGMEVCHSCDIGGCCNPGHLWLGNSQRQYERYGREKSVKYQSQYGNNTHTGIL